MSDAPEHTAPDPLSAHVHRTVHPQLRDPDRLPRALLAACALLVVLVAGAILLFIARTGLEGLWHTGLTRSLFGLRWAPESATPSFGFLGFLFTTVATAVGSIVLGGLPAVLAAVYLSEFASRRAREGFRRVMEVASALPSVVFGYAAMTWLLPRLADPQRGCQGFGALPATIVLGVMIAPTIALLSLDALARTPDGLRDASFALGVSRWKTAWWAVVPCASRGLLVAVFFGLARAAGETMAVQMVAGNGPLAPATFLRPDSTAVLSSACATLGPFEPLRPTSTVATRIVTDMANTQPGTPWNNILFSMSLVLLVLSTLVVLIIRRLSNPPVH